MAETSAQDARSAERLHDYWVRGDGAAKIRWGEPNDFQRCVDHLGKFIADPQGYCNLAHHAALGIWPATHAADIRKTTGRSAVTTATRTQISTADQNNAPDSDFAYIETGGTKDGSGKTIPRALRHFYVGDADHVRNALSRAPQSPFGDKAMPKIRQAAKKLGVDVADDDAKGAPVSRGEFTRIYPLENIEILRTESPGPDGHPAAAPGAGAVQHMLPQSQPGAVADPLPAGTQARLPVGSVSPGDGGNNTSPGPLPSAGRRMITAGANGHG